MKNELNEDLEQNNDLSVSTEEPLAEEALPVEEASNEEEKIAEEEKEAEEEFLSDQAKVLSPAGMVAKRFFRSKLSIFGLVTLIILFLFSFIGPLFSPWGQKEQDESGMISDCLANEYTYVGADGNTYTFYDVTYDELKINSFAPPSADHWLGTDQNGYDVFTRLMYGGRISLTLGFVVVILETIIGIIMGGLAGYFGKWVDQLIMRIVDVLICLPSFPILLIASSLLDAWKIDQDVRIYYLMVILTLFGWSGMARLVRGQILMLRDQEFMLAAEATGLSTKRKIFKHLIPNVMPYLIVSMTLGLGSIILTEASLSFLGLGMSYPAAAWGSMIDGATKNTIILQKYFNIWGPPGFCIVLAILAFNFIGDGLRDAIDPKMKR